MWHILCNWGVCELVWSRLAGNANSRVSELLSSGWPLGCQEKLFALDWLPHEPKAVLEQRPKKLNFRASDKAWLIQFYLLTFSLEGQSSHQHLNFPLVQVSLGKKKFKKKNISTGKKLRRYSYWDIQIYWMLSL